MNNKIFNSSRSLKKKITDQLKLYLIYIISFKFNKKKFNIDKINKILIRINDPIGDSILTTPIYRELKLINPNMQIDLILSNRNKLIFNNNPYISTIFIPKSKSNFSLQVLKLMRKNNYDISLDLYGKISFSFFIQLIFINAKYNIANSTSIADSQKYHISTHQLKFFDYVFGKNLDIHHRDRYLEFFDILDHNIKNKQYEIFLTKSDYKHTELFKKSIKNTNPFIGINYKGSNSGNSLSIDTTIQLSKLLAVKFPNFTYILFSEPKFMKEAQYIIDKINKTNVLLTYKTNSILELSSLINNCHTIITTGTSAMHIASAFNKNIIAIYPNTQYYYTFEPKTQGVCKIINTLSKYNTSNIDIHLVSKALEEIINEN